MIGDFVVYHENSTVDPTTHSLVDKEVLSLQSHKWKNDKIKDICPMIKEWKVVTLWAYTNDCPDIIKDIGEILFSKINLLSLIQNKIQSIEGLTRVRMPVLRQLYIGYNTITYVSDMKKSNYSQMFTFTMNQNKIKEAHCLQVMRSKSLRQIDVEYMLDDRELCSDIKWLAKLQTCEIDKLWIASAERIKQKNLMTVLKKKYTEMTVMEK